MLSEAFSFYKELYLANHFWLWSTSQLKTVSSIHRIAPLISLVRRLSIIEQFWIFI